MEDTDISKHQILLIKLIVLHCANYICFLSCSELNENIDTNLMFIKQGAKARRRLA